MKKIKKRIVKMVLAVIMLMIAVISDYQLKAGEREKPEVVQTPLTEKDYQKLGELAKEDETPLTITRRADLTVSVADAGFLSKTKKMLGRKKDSEKYSFVIFELQDRGVILSGEEMAFLPVEKILVGSRESWLLLPVSHKDAIKNGFHEVYEEMFYASADPEKYREQMAAFLAFYKKRILAGSELEGIVLSNWGESQVGFQNMKFMYHFEAYSTYEDDGITIYRKASGTPVWKYLDLPHSFTIDQGKSGTAITLSIQ